MSSKQMREGVDEKQTSTWSYCVSAAADDVGVPQVCDMLQLFLEKKINRGRIGVVVIEFKVYVNHK